MRSEAVCDACFGLMVREDRTPTPGHHTIPCATRPPTPNHPKRSLCCCLLRTSQDNDGDDDKNDLDHDADEWLGLAPPTKPGKVGGF